MSAVNSPKKVCETVGRAISLDQIREHPNWSPDEFACLCRSAQCGAFCVNLRICNPECDSACSYCPKKNNAVDTTP